MDDVVIRVEKLSKKYQLGQIGYGSLQSDFASWWAKVRKKEDPNTLVDGSNLSTRHGDFWALNDVSFEVRAGQRLGILGRNGAGKSTLLKILSQVTSPTKGRVKIRGRVASLLEVGTGFHGELTGRENVFLNGAINGMKRREIQRKFDEIVDFSGVSEFIDTPVKRYSSGMTVKLAFAVAAHLDSEILIADEVLAVGDAEFQKKSLGKMRDVSTNQGRTVLFVSHQLGTIRSLCDVGMILHKGELVQQGSMGESVQEYLKMTEGRGANSGVVSFETRSEAVAQVMEIRQYRNGHLLESGTLDAYDELAFEIDLKVTVPVKGLHFLLRCHLEGEVLFTALECSDNEAILQERSPGTVTVRASIPSGFLRVGNYSFSLTLARWAGKDLETHENLLPVEILLGSRNSTYHQAAMINLGKVNAPVQWTYERK